MQPIRALLWDIDGTLLNFAASERAGICQTFDAFALGPCTEQMLSAYSRINTKWWERLERGECSKHETMTGRFSEFFAMFQLDADIEAFNEEYQRRLPETIVFNDGAWEVLTKCRNRFLQYAVTNGNRPVQRRKLRDSGMDKVFDGVFISDEVGYEKPSIEYFRFVLDAIGCAPSEAMIIGDSLTSDMRGGNNAGLVCCWYNPARLPLPNDLRIDCTIERLDELFTVFERVPAKSE